jgi:uncharacterized Tic20 family protein
MLLDQDSREEDIRPWNMDINSFCMLMHLSQFASSVFPLAGIIMPILMWQQFKKQSTIVDENGKQLVNFMLTSVITGIVSAIVIAVIALGLFANTRAEQSGFTLLWAIVILFLVIGLGIAYVIFIIRAAIQSYNGNIGTYPLTIKFIR